MLTRAVFNQSLCAALAHSGPAEESQLERHAAAATGSDRPASSCQTPPAGGCPPPPSAPQIAQQRPARRPQPADASRGDAQQAGERRVACATGPANAVPEDLGAWQAGRACPDVRACSGLWHFPSLRTSGCRCCGGPQAGLPPVGCPGEDSCLHVSGRCAICTAGPHGSPSSGTGGSDAMALRRYRQRDAFSSWLHICRNRFTIKFQK